MIICSFFSAVIIVHPVVSPIALLSDGVLSSCASVSKATGGTHSPQRGCNSPVASQAQHRCSTWEMVSNQKHKHIRMQKVALGECNDRYAHTNDEE